MIQSMKQVLPRLHRRGRRGPVPRVLPLALLTLAIGCGGPGPPRPDIVLITIDTLRADHLEPYGARGIETPAIARLAREGVLFENAFTDVSWTVPAVSSVLTGRYATEHGVRSWHDRLADDEVTIAERLHAAGYATAAIVGSFPLVRSFGFAQGFDHYDDALDNPMGGADETEDPGSDSDWLEQRMEGFLRWMGAAKDFKGYRDDSEVADLALAWLDASPRRPFFLWVHFLGPHLKNVAYPTVEERIAAYRANVPRVDAEVGRVLERLRAPEFADSTVVILHSDHGESLKEHGVVGHGMDLFDSTAHVPLIVKLPAGRRAGERVTALARNVDLFPTIAGLAGLDATPGVGQDLLSGDLEARHAYLETWETRWLSSRDAKIDGASRRVGTVLRGIRTPDWKLVVEEPGVAEVGTAPTALPKEYVEKARRVRLYHVSTDPGERHDVARADPARTAELLGLLEGHVDHSLEHAQPVQRLDEDARKRLEALGYVPPR